VAVDKACGGGENHPRRCCEQGAQNGQMGRAWGLKLGVVRSFLFRG